jgi:hypothetical protein
MDLEGSGRGLFHTTIAAFTWINWKKNENTTAGMTDIPAETRI